MGGGGALVTREQGSGALAREGELKQDWLANYLAPILESPRQVRTALSRFGFDFPSSQWASQWLSKHVTTQHFICHYEAWRCNNYVDIKLNNFWSKAHDPESKYALRSLCDDIKSRF